MTAPVTKDGVLIPRRMLGKAKVVEIRRERSRIVVQPIDESDPLRKLAENPISLGIDGASDSVDHLLYCRQ